MSYDQEYEGRQKATDVHRYCRLGDIEALSINGVEFYLDDVKIHYYKTYYTEGYEAEYKDARIHVGDDIQIAALDCFLNSIPTHNNEGVTAFTHTWAHLIEEALIDLSIGNINWSEED